MQAKHCTARKETTRQGMQTVPCFWLRAGWKDLSPEAADWNKDKPDDWPDDWSVAPALAHALPPLCSSSECVPVRHPKRVLPDCMHHSETLDVPDLSVRPVLPALSLPSIRCNPVTHVR